MLPSWAVRWEPLWCRIVCSVPRRGLQQCYNNISVFILVWHVFVSSLLTKPLVQHDLSRVGPIQLRDFPLPRVFLWTTTHVSFGTETCTLTIYAWHLGELHLVDSSSTWLWSHRFQTYGHRCVEEGLGGELSTRDSETLSMDRNVLLILL